MTLYEMLENLRAATTRRRLHAGAHPSTDNGATTRRTMKTESTRPRVHPFNPGRRALLKAGVAGAALLLAGRWLAPAFAATPRERAYAFLTAEDAVILRRIAPVLLQGALPQNPEPQQAAITEVIAGVDQTSVFLAPGVRKELRDLFNLLNLGVTRALLAGVWKPWEQASDEDVAKFLSNWRDSRFGLLRSAYTALHDLVIGSWYSNPKSWPRIGYGGPPTLA